MIPQMLERFARGLDAIVEFVGRIAAWASLALVLVMAGNVLMRYVFRIGSVGMQELEWHLLAPLVLLCIAYTLKNEGHLRVDVFYSSFPRRGQQLIDLISVVIALAVCAYIIKLSVPYVMQSYRIGEASPDPGGLPHRFIVKSMIPAGFTLLLLHSLAEFCRALKPFFGGRGGTTAIVSTHAVD